MIIATTEQNVFIMSSTLQFESTWVVFNDFVIVYTIYFQLPTKPFFLATFLLLHLLWLV